MFLTMVLHHEKLEEKMKKGTEYFMEIILL